MYLFIYSCIYSSIHVSISVCLISIYFLLQILAQFAKYEHLYTQEQSQVIAEFLTVSKHLSDFEGEIDFYERLEQEIASLPQQLAIGHTILISTGKY